MAPSPPLAPDELVAAGPERAILEAFLDWHRDVLVRKVAGLSEEDARRRLVPSMTTLAGLLKHMIGVERGWFQKGMGQLTAEEMGPGPGGGPGGWVLEGGDTIDALVAAYQEACRRSRDIAARLSMDDTVPNARLGRMSLRWVYVHMIEETARHVGHADILREQIDGATGVDG
jgi:hypothetical protein